MNTLAAVLIPALIAAPPTQRHQAPTSAKSPGYDGILIGQAKADAIDVALSLNPGNERISESIMVRDTDGATIDASFGEYRGREVVVSISVAIGPNKYATLMAALTSKYGQPYAVNPYRMWARWTSGPASIELTNGFGQRNECITFTHTWFAAMQHEARQSKESSKLD